MSYLYDDETWTTGVGHTLRIAEMAPDHARNAKNMMLRNAQQTVRRLALRAAFRAFEHDGGDLAQSFLEREMYRLECAAESAKASVDVVKTMPAFKALKRRARAKT